MRIPQQVSERVKEAPAQALRAVFSGIGQVLLVADRIKSRAAEPDRARPAQAEPVTQSRPASATAAKDETRWRSLDETGNVRLLSDEDAAKARPPATTPPVTEVSAASDPAAAAQPTAGPIPTAEIAETLEATETIEAARGAETVQADEAAQPAETIEAIETVEITEPPQTSNPAQPSEAQASETPETSEPAPAAENASSGQIAAAQAAALPVANYDSLTVASLRARLRNLDPSQVRVLLDYEKANAGRAEVLTMYERRIIKLEGDGT